jgi:methylenetetrahydrofolate dehydrogenase (NADP+)/methenyltetrahydrofolate cyclohydrolase
MAAAPSHPLQAPAKIESPVTAKIPAVAVGDDAPALHTISVHKDVDGFRLYNVGGLVAGTVFPPCSPYDALNPLQHEQMLLKGRNVVVVGASEGVAEKASYIIPVPVASAR